MKNSLKLFLWFQAIMLSLILNNNITAADIPFQANEISSRTTEISLPDNLLLYCILPKNDTNQTHWNNYIHDLKRIFKAITTAAFIVSGNKCSLVHYFDFCCHITISLPISAIIFPFNYFW